jgi:hypothetical protein
VSRGVLFTGLAAGAQAVARLTPLTSVHLETGDCPSPCWQGIQRGSSERYEVEQQSHGWFDNLAAFFNSPYRVTASGLEDYLELFALHTLGSGRSAGEVLRVLSPPDAISCIQALSSSSQGQSARAANLYFVGDQVEVSGLLPDTARRLTPDAQVFGVCYYARPIVAQTCPGAALPSSVPIPAVMRMLPPPAAAYVVPGPGPTRFSLEIDRWPGNSSCLRRLFASVRSASYRPSRVT